MMHNKKSKFNINRINGLRELNIDLDNIVGNSTTCPQCSPFRKKSTQRCLSVDIFSGNFFCNHCGWQGRADSDDWLNREPNTKFVHTKLKETPGRDEQQKLITFLPEETWELETSDNNLTNFLHSKFNSEDVNHVLNLYDVRTNHRYWINSVAFLQKDKYGNLRQVKVMDYNVTTGKRVIDSRGRVSIPRVRFIGQILAEEAFILDHNLKQCFFGEHLLKQFPDKVVGLVESEKTAIICQILIPHLVWLATGGKNGCQWYDPKSFEVLRGRVLDVYPDNDEFQAWNSKVTDQKLNSIATVRVRDDFYKNQQPGEEKFDLADYIINFLER
jgi:hypothetical protein